MGSTLVPFIENEEAPGSNKSKPDAVIPAQRLAKIKNGKTRKNYKSDNFLNGFKLCRRKITMTYPVGGHLEAIFKKSYTPADQNNQEEGDGLVFEMAIPREGHEDIRDQKQANGEKGCGNKAHVDFHSLDFFTLSSGKAA
jgi:hypothetical protein